MNRADYPHKTRQYSKIALLALIISSVNFVLSIYLMYLHFKK